jgi:ribonuclease HI
MKQASLLPTPPAHQDPAYVAYIDGGSRGNPGPAGFGVVIADNQGNTIETIATFLGKATNNVAEYSALLAALEYVLGNSGRTLQVYCDSELVVRQMQGRYRVQSPDLKPLFERARKLAGQLERFSIQHIPREQNARADQLANDAMDGAGRSSSKPAPRPASPAPPATRSLMAVCEGGLLRPLPGQPQLEEGAEYEVKLRKRR